MIDITCHLKTLGIPELRRADGREVKFRVRKHFALLIYLAVDWREWHRRDALVDLLWQNVPGDKGRHSLSVALSVLRATLGPRGLETNPTHVRLNRACLALDINELGAGEPQDVDRFLLDFEVQGAPSFHHWRDRQHAELLPAIRSGLMQIQEDARRRGDLRRVMVLSERLLTIDPLSEEGIRARITALAMQGERVTALQVYEAWRDNLKMQLGALPSEGLQEVASRLRRPVLPRPPERTGPVVQVDQWAERNFVGRTDAYQVLTEAWEATTRLETRHVLITGETGIGKSTLALRFASAAFLEGAAVARVQCFEMEQRIPYGMIGALVTSLLDRPGATATAPQSLAEIARIVPAVKSRFSGLPPHRETEGEAARLHFAEGCFALFDSIMEEQPLLLLIDDYPRSDEASLAVLHMLLRRVGNDRLMVVLTGRPSEPDEPAQSQRIRKGLAYLPMQQVTLGPLSDEESELMLTAVLRGTGKEPGAAVRRAIVLGAAGNPMALDLLGQDWAQHGDLALAISLPAMRTEMPHSAMEAAKYDHVIERLLPALPPRTRTTLFLAAVLGPRLDDMGFFEIVGLNGPQTLGALSELSARRILRDPGAGLEFSNELLRARIYLRVPPSVRVRLHDRVASRLLDHLACNLPVPGLEIAWHCIRARRREEATPYLLAGAKKAIHNGGPDEAIRALATAIGHLKGTSRDQACLLLADAYQEMAEWKAALESVEEMSPQHQDDCCLADMARVRRRISEIALDILTPDQRAAAAAELICLAKSNASPSASVEALLAATSIGSQLASRPIMEEVLRVAPTVAVDGLEPRDRGKYLLARGVANHDTRQRDNGRAEAIEGVRVLREAGATDSTFVRLQIGLGATACSRGHYEDAIPPLKEAFKAAHRIDNSTWMARAAANLMLCYHRLGLPAEQLRWSVVGERSLNTDALHYLSFTDVYTHRCFSLEALGKLQEAKSYLPMLEKAAHMAPPGWLRQFALLQQAEVNWKLGSKSRGAALAKTALGQNGGLPTMSSVGKVARWSTFLMIRDGRYDELQNLLEKYALELERFDMLDQAEIVCGLETLRLRVRPFLPDRSQLAREILSRLPIPCSNWLADFGLLLPDGRPQSLPKALL